MNIGDYVMTMLDVGDYTITGGLISAVSTAAVDQEALGVVARERGPSQQGWQDVIDKNLVEWGRNPGALDDEGVVPPSRAVINRACLVAIEARDQGEPPPNRVVPNGDGGIVFERWHDSVSQTIEIYNDGTIELAVYKDSCLLTRRHIF